MDEIFFLLSKTMVILIEPLAHPYVLVVFSLITYRLKKRHLTKVLIGSAIALPWIYGVVPISTAGIMLLENRFNIPDLSHRPITGIVVMGGHMGDGLTAMQRSQIQQNDGDRLSKGFIIQRRHPDAKLVFAGYSSKINPKGWTEAQMIRNMLEEMGLKNDKIEFETQSRNSFDTAEKIRDIYNVKDSGEWVLITSASHMPRAIGAFRKVGWENIIAYPVDFISGTSHNHYFSLATGTNRVRLLLHEIVGLLVYRMTGRSSTLFPMQRSQ